MSSQSGYLPPELIDPLTRRCVTIYVPDDQLWWAAFWGQMTSLADTWYWEGTPEQKAEITSVWMDVLQSARENWLAGDCELALEFRVVNGIVEYRPDASAGWTAIGEACPCPPVIPSPQYNPDIADPAEMACNIAVGIIEWLMTKYGDVLDQIAAATSTAGAFDAIFLIFPPAYLIADMVLDAIQEVINATVAIARAYDTVERREEMQQWLYCEMIATGEMTSEIWSSFKQAFIDGEFGGDSPGRAAMYAYFQSFEEEAVLARARIESYGSGNCVAFNCGDEWEQIFDFQTEASLLGWTARGSYGTPSITANGLQAVTFLDTGLDPDVSRRAVYIGKDCTYADPSTRIVSVESFYNGGNAGNSNTSPASMIAPRIRENESANVASAGNHDISLPDGSTSAEFTSQPEIETDYYVLISTQFGQRNDDTDQPVTGNGYVSKYIVRGTGKNPFIP